jgi:hypothetical protein
MKIAIIGGGWVGCHLANHLKKTNQVILYEKNQIFSESSFFNQNRLHLGYHYSRSYNTRILCKDTFDKFYHQYSFLVENIKKNIYSIPLNDSLIDFNTYLKIFEDFNTHELVSTKSLKNIEGSILVQEKYINPIKSKKYFEEELKDIVNYKEILDTDIENIQKDYDLVINATNNKFFPITENTFYENCVVLLYEKIGNPEFDALTLVDGKLMSIYPYDLNKNLYSLTDVEFTPQANLPIQSIKRRMENKVLNYYPNFLSDFKYYSYATSTKCKIKNLSDTRVPLIQRTDNVVSCFTGKIQGIYLIQDYIDKL